MVYSSQKAIDVKERKFPIAFQKEALNCGSLVNTVARKSEVMRSFTQLNWMAFLTIFAVQFANGVI
jgi:hypothetical protein